MAAIFGNGDSATMMSASGFEGAENEGDAMTFTSIGELVRVLSSNEIGLLQTVLARFRKQALAESKQENNLVHRYLDSSPEAKEFFRVWNFAIELLELLFADRWLHHLIACLRSDNQVPTLDIPIMNAFHAILQHTRTSASAKNNGFFIARKSYIRLIHRHLGSTNPPLIMATLSLLTIVNSQGDQIPRELMQAFNFVYKPLERFLAMRRANPGAKGLFNDVRSVYIRFAFSFLIHGDVSVKKDILEIRDFISGIFKGISQDSFELVKYILLVLHEHIFQNKHLARTSKIGLANKYFLDQLLKLYKRTNDRAAPGSDEKTNSKITVADLVHDFFNSICCTPGEGLCFKESGWYAAKSKSKGNIKVYNKVLMDFLTLLDPVEDARQRSLLIGILRACPELVQSFWSSYSGSFDPRPSPKWHLNQALACKIISLPVPSLLDPETNSPYIQPPPASTVVANILPPNITRQLLAKGLQHADSNVRLDTARLLCFVFEKLTKVIAEFEQAGNRPGVNHAAWLACNTAILEEIRRQVPDFQIAISAYSQVEKLVGTKDDTAEELRLQLLRVIINYQRHLSESILETRFDFLKLIPANLLAEKPVFQEDLLQLLAITKNLKWQTAHGSSGHSYFATIVKCFLLSPHVNIRQKAHQLLLMIWKETALFEAYEHELQLWLLRLKQQATRHPDSKDLNRVVQIVDHLYGLVVKTPYDFLDTISQHNERSLGASEAAVWIDVMIPESDEIQLGSEYDQTTSMEIEDEGNNLGSKTHTSSESDLQSGKQAFLQAALDAADSDILLLRPFSPMVVAAIRLLATSDASKGGSNQGHGALTIDTFSDKLSISFLYRVLSDAISTQRRCPLAIDSLLRETMNQSMGDGSACQSASHTASSTMSLADFSQADYIRSLLREANSLANIPIENANAETSSAIENSAPNSAVIASLKSVGDMTAKLSQLPGVQVASALVALLSGKDTADSMETLTSPNVVHFLENAFPATASLFSFQEFGQHFVPQTGRIHPKRAAQETASSAVVRQFCSRLPPSFLLKNAMSAGLKTLASLHFHECLVAAVDLSMKKNNDHQHYHHPHHQGTDASNPESGDSDNGSRWHEFEAWTEARVLVTQILLALTSVCAKLASTQLEPNEADIHLGIRALNHLLQALSKIIQLLPVVSGAGGDQGEMPSATPSEEAQPPLSSSQIAKERIAIIELIFSHPIFKALFTKAMSSEGKGWSSQIAKNCAKYLIDVITQILKNGQPDMHVGSVQSCMVFFKDVLLKTISKEVEAAKIKNEPSPSPPAEWMDMLRGLSAASLPAVSSESKLVKLLTAAIFSDSTLLLSVLSSPYAMTIEGWYLKINEESIRRLYALFCEKASSDLDELVLEMVIRAAPATARETVELLLPKNKKDTEGLSMIHDETVESLAATWRQCDLANAVFSEADSNLFDFCVQKSNPRRIAIVGTFLSAGHDKARRWFLHRGFGADKRVNEGETWRTVPSLSFLFDASSTSTSSASASSSLSASASSTPSKRRKLNDGDANKEAANTTVDNANMQVKMTGALEMMGLENWMPLALSFAKSASESGSGEVWKACVQRMRELLSNIIWEDLLAAGSKTSAFSCNLLLALWQDHIADAVKALSAETLKALLIQGVKQVIGYLSSRKASQLVNGFDKLLDAIGELLEVVEQKLQHESFDEIKPLLQPLLIACLRHHYKNEHVLFALAKFLALVYSSNSRKTLPALSNIIEMIFGHSQFPVVYLSRNLAAEQQKPTRAGSSTSKRALVYLIARIVELDPTAIEEQYIPVLLQGYHASTDIGDRITLSILHAIEIEGRSVAAHAMAWGPTAAQPAIGMSAGDGSSDSSVENANRSDSYAPYGGQQPSRTNNLHPSNQRQHEQAHHPGADKIEHHGGESRRMLEFDPVTYRALSCIDPIMMMNAVHRMRADSSLNFVSVKEIKSPAQILDLGASGDSNGAPTNRRDPRRFASEGGAGIGAGIGIGDPNCYDIAFMLPLFANLLSTSDGKIDIRRFVELNCLGVLVRALSSDEENARRASYYCLDLFYSIFQEADFREKQQLWLLVDSFRNALITREGFPRIPAVITYFVAQAAHIFFHADHFMYPLINKFLLQRSFLDIEDVPMFYNLFNSSNEFFKRERAWILKLLTGAILNPADVKLLKRRHVIELLMSFYDSAMSDALSQDLVLEIFESLSRIPSCMLEIINFNGFLGWVQFQAMTHRDKSMEDSSLKKLIGLVERITPWVAQMPTFGRVVTDQANNITDVLGNMCD